MQVILSYRTLSSLQEWVLSSYQSWCELAMAWCLNGAVAEGNWSEQRRDLVCNLTSGRNFGVAKCARVVQNTTRTTSSTSTATMFRDPRLKQILDHLPLPTPYQPVPRGGVDSRIISHLFNGFTLTHASSQSASQWPQSTNSYRDPFDLEIPQVYILPIDVESPVSLLSSPPASTDHNRIVASLIDPTKNCYCVCWGPASDKVNHSPCYGKKPQALVDALI